MCRVRLVSLAAQKFVAEVTHDALQLWKQQRQAPQQKLREQGIDPKDRRPVLSMEHVANALQEVASALRTLLSMLQQSIWHTAGQASMSYCGSRQQLYYQFLQRTAM